MIKINLYTMDSCIRCKDIKKLLDDNSIPYKELSSDKDLRFLLNKGIKHVPVIEIKGSFYVGPDAMIKAEEIVSDFKKRR